MEGAEDFFKVYANVPLDERRNVLIVVNSNPISWDLANQMIKNNSAEAKEILKLLKELEII